MRWHLKSAKRMETLQGSIELLPVCTVDWSIDYLLIQVGWLRWVFMAHFRRSP